GHPAPARRTGEGPPPVTLAGLLDLSGTTHTNAGTYATDAWAFAGNSNYNDATGTVNDRIAKADPVMTATGGTFTYDGTSHAGSGTAKGVLGEDLTPVTVAYKDALNNLLTSAPVNAGTYSVAARYAGDANYNQKQSAAAALIINKADSATVVTVAGGVTFTYDGNAHPATVAVTGAGGLSL